MAHAGELPVCRGPAGKPARQQPTDRISNSRRSRPAREIVSRGTAARKVDRPSHDYDGPDRRLLDVCAATRRIDESDPAAQQDQANIAEILKRGVTITDFRVPGMLGSGKSLVVQLKYGPNRERTWPVCAGFRSRVCECTRNPPICREFSAAWAATIISHVFGSVDRPPGSTTGRGRRSPRFRVVAGGNRLMSRVVSSRCRCQPVSM